MDDQKLVSLFKQGNKDAFISLYRTYVDPIYRFVLRRVSNATEAEDLTQETFMAALDQLKPTELTTSFKSWLFAIAVNKIKAYWLKEYQMPKASIEQLLETDTLLPTAQSGEPEPISADEEELLKFIATLLPAEQAEIIMLRFYRGLSRKETAEILGLSENTVKVFQYRALQTLHTKGPAIFSTMRPSHV